MNVHYRGVLPAHTLTVSARARRVRLVITPATGLRVVVPKGFDRSLVPAILAERLPWIEHHLELARQAQAGREAALTPPETVELRAIGRVLRVRYLLTAAKGVSASGEGDMLTVRGAISERDAVFRALRAWLVRRGKAVLPELLAAQGSRLGLPFTGVTIRLQRRRWGSYSARGGVSLNARLLFLPPEITRYVLIHELAHSRHLNHSDAYWKYLEGLCPGAAALDKALRRAGGHVPAWADLPG